MFPPPYKKRGPRPRTRPVRYGTKFVLTEGLGFVSVLPFLSAPFESSVRTSAVIFAASILYRTAVQASFESFASD